MTDRSTRALARVTSHPAIDDDHVVERYLTGMLSAEQEEAFEAHSIACDRCLEELEADERFRAAFAGILGNLQPEPTTTSVVSSETTAEPSSAGRHPAEPGPSATPLEAVSSSPSPLPQRTPRARPTHRWALAAVAVLAVAAALLLQRQNARLIEQLGALESPHAAPPWLRLQPLRAAGPEPVARLYLARSTPWALVTLEAEPPMAQSYACSLRRDGAATTLWQGSLAPDLWGGLTVLVPTTDLVPGLYALRCRPEPDPASGAAAEAPSDPGAETIVRFEVFD